MSDEFDISVVISTFNRATQLEHALRGLVAQDVPAALRYEIIVVDNNSSDNTREVVAAFEREHGPRVRYVLEPRQGVSFGRNAGISAALAPVVAFTDDDNVVTPSWVATLKDALDRYPDADAVGGPVLPQWPAKVPRWLDRHHWSPLAIVDYGDTRFYTSTNDPRCLLTANMAVRRPVFDRVGGFSPEFPRCQDHEWLIRLWRSGGRALYAPELVVHAPVPPERLTKKYHRAWHSRHGYYAAAMRLEEIVDLSGRMHPEPAGGQRLFGAPPHLFAEVFRAIRQSAMSLVRGDYPLALRGAYHVRYLMAYIRRTRRDRGLRRTGSRRDAMGLAPWETAQARTMSTPRMMFVHALLFVLVGGSLYDIKTGREHWPFSPYPMFSIVDDQPSVRCLRVVGVTAGAAPRELLLIENELIHPFDQCRLTSAFSRAYSDPQRRSVIREQLRDCLERYEVRRRAGEHHGPPLRAVRLYEMRWTLDADAANVDTPDTRSMVEEVEWAAPTTAGF